MGRRPNPVVPLSEFRIEDDIELSPFDAFRQKYGRPEDEARWPEWAGTRLPSSGYLRRLAVVHLLDLYGPVCELCGGKIDRTLLDADSLHPARAELDHIVPRAAQGLDVWGNVRATHRACNNERRDERVPLDTEWLARVLAAELAVWQGKRKYWTIARMRERYYRERSDALRTEANRLRGEANRERKALLRDQASECWLLAGEWWVRAHYAKRGQPLPST